MTNNSHTARAVPLLVAVLVVASLAPPAAAAGDARAYVGISNATVSPATPAPGDLVTVSVTVRNLQQSNSTLDVDYVELRRNSNFRYSRASNLGSLAPGTSLTVPLTATFDSPGTKDLHVNVVGYESDGDRVSARYPVVVQVARDRPQVDVQADSPVANAETTVNATVANGLPEDVRNVDLTLDGTGVTVQNPRRVHPRVAAGSEVTDAYTVVADASGIHRITATLNYTTAGGTRRSVTHSTRLDFAPLRDRVDVQARRTGTGSSLDVRVSNLGNVPLENVTVSAEASGADVTRALVRRIRPQRDATVTLNATGVNGTTPATVVATYDVGVRRGRASASATLTSNPGTITLTGLDVSREDGKLHITGSASNVGLSQANSVVVRVQSGAGVEPAYPGREYFVGSVPKSDFVTFDVYARAADGATDVPVSVSYLVRGTRHRRTFSVPIEAQPTQSAPSGGGSLPLALAIGALVVVVVAAFVVVAWRNSRGGD